ncbi:hypothetical protein N7474_004830 [Penicillium riverlandense]|uniref:uncharacterized protein n=1 Tax=Penicillium riverlandense TaxID=1903569 RepID=UPI0025474C21|nr:uncharacterized protein N7474_004830 [Penicillium riverlandense]KAJ5819239.1 hypothetical protein N7474_004830 [Penicillium riverlandense]
MPNLRRTESDLGAKKMAIPRLAEGAESAFTSPGRFHRRHAYEDVIRKLSNRFGVSDEQLVNIALAVDSAPDLTLDPDAPVAAMGDRKLSWRSGSEPPPSRSSSVAPPELVDHTEEDFNRDETARATGYIGKSSEITWLQKLSKEVSSECDAWSTALSSNADENTLPSPKLTPRPESQGDPWVASSNYYLDDLEIPNAGHVDTSEIPSREAAGKLLNSYLTSVHPSFPIIGISTFVSQFQVFFSQPSLKPGNKWLAILNLIFAIALKYEQLTNADFKEGEEGHQIYFSRAMALSLEDQLLNHPDLQQLQVEGLASFYLIACGHINRAWKLSGGAVRGALALGLHLRNMGMCTSDTSKEIRYRVWWSLYTLEHLLAVITGRPSCIIDSSCTTPLPVPFDECDFQRDEVAQLISTAGRGSNHLDRISANSNSAASLDSSAESDGNTAPAESDTKVNRADYLRSLPPCMSLYFLQLTSLTTIAKRMTVKLYSPEAQQSPWASTEFIIQSLMLEIDSWFMNLPAAYDFTSTQTSQCPLSQRIGLAFLFYSTKIGIARPCLCRLDSSHPEGERTHEFCSKTAAECVEAACHMLTLFPDTPDAALLYRMSPWWCTLHYLMQTSTVLLLELALKVQHVPEKASMVLKAAKKSLDWLAALSKTNMASKRAWKLCEGFLRRLAPHVGINMSDFPDSDEVREISVLDAADATDPAALIEDQLPTAADEDDFVTFDPASTIPTSTATAVDAIAAELDYIACPPMDQSDTSLGTDVPYNLEPSDLLDQFMKPEKSGSGRSSYDDYFPCDPAAGQITGSFFPAGPNLDLDLGYFWGDPVC